MVRQNWTPNPGYFVRFVLTATGLVNFFGKKKRPMKTVPIPGMTEALRFQGVFWVFWALNEEPTVCPFGILGFSPFQKNVAWYGMTVFCFCDTFICLGKRLNGFIPDLDESDEGRRVHDARMQWFSKNTSFKGGRGEVGPNCYVSEGVLIQRRGLFQTRLQVFALFHLESGWIWYQYSTPRADFPHCCAHFAQVCLDTLQDTLARAIPTPGP